MANFTTYHEELIMNRSFHGVDAPTAPTSLFVGLHTGPPTESGEENEVSAGDYSRQEVPNAEWDGTGSSVTNGTAIEFGTAVSTWGEIQYVSVWNGDQGSATADALWYAELNTPKGPIEDGDEVRFSIGTLSFEAN